MKSPRVRLRSLRLAGAGPGGSTRSLFINRIGLWLAILLGVLGAAVGNRGLLLLGALVLFAAAVTAVWNRLSLTRLEYSRHLSSDRYFSGESGQLTIEIFNNKPVPVPWLSIDEDLSEFVQPSDRLTAPTGSPGRRLLHLQTHLGPFERVRWKIPINCPQRGSHTLGPTVLRASDPLGFFASRLEIGQIDRLIVYPKVTSLDSLQLPHQYLIGDRRIPRHVLSDPLRIAGVRDHRPEDPLNSIHWKATARQGILQVRVTEPSTMLHLSILLNIDTFNNYWEGLDVKASEEAIEVAASMAMWALEHRYGVGLSSNGIAAMSDQPLRIPHGRGPRQRLMVLEGLARLSAYSSMSFPKIVAQESNRLTHGSTLVLITSLLSDGLVMQMRTLLAAGHRVVLVPVRDCPVPAIRGLAVRQFAVRANDDRVTEEPEVVNG